MIVREDVKEAVADMAEARKMIEPEQFSPEKQEEVIAILKRVDISLSYLLLQSSTIALH